MSPRNTADLEWPLSEGMQVSTLPTVWIAMIISCRRVKRLKFPSVTLTHVCGTNSHSWWAKGLPGVGVVKIFCDSDSLGWKSFRLLDSDSTALPATAETEKWLRIRVRFFKNVWLRLLLRVRKKNAESCRSTPAFWIRSHLRDIAVARLFEFFQTDFFSRCEVRNKKIHGRIGK